MGIIWKDERGINKMKVYQGSKSIYIATSCTNNAIPIQQTKQ